MDSVLQDIPFFFVSLDDTLVASTNADEHLMHLWLLFKCLSEHWLIVNRAACQFASFYFLGHHVTPEGAVTLPARVEAVARFPRPGTVKYCRSFWKC